MTGRHFDNENFRRKTGRSAEPTTQVDERPFRFFKTQAGPGATAYPTTGQVVYAKLLRDITFSLTPGASIGSGTPVNSYAYLGVLNGAIPPPGTIVAATKIGSRWWITLGLNLALVKTTVTHAKGDTKACNVYQAGSKGSETWDGSTTIMAYNRFVTLPANRWSIACGLWNGWELIAGECGAPLSSSSSSSP